MGERLLVIGGDAAGMSVAAAVRRARPELEIVVLERGQITSYAACGIPYHVSGAVPDLDDLVVRTPEEFRAHGIEVRTGTEAVSLDLDARTVESRRLHDGATETVGFDLLMLGTGARPAVPDWPGVELPHVSTAHTLPDAARVSELAHRTPAGRAVVVGGGYVGLEMAESLLARGLDVTMVDRSVHLMGNLDEGMAGRVADAARREGITLHLGVAVDGISERSVSLTDGSEVPADLVVLGVGVTPNTELFAAAGLATGIKGALVVDDHQRTGVDGVYAGGDCCESFHRVSRRPTWVALGTVANKAGRVAAANIAGGDMAFGGVLGTAITRLVTTEIARTGLSEGQARAAGFDPVATTIETTTRAGYFPGAEPMAVQLVHDRGTRALLGGQIVGGSGAGKRIDTVAAALWGGLDIDAVAELDLAYAPPFSSVWDPVNVAARKASG